MIRKKRAVIGYIYCEGRGLGKDEKCFIKSARKNHVELVMFNISDRISEEDLKKRAERCDIIFNNSAEDIAMELVKTFEEFGKKVVDSSKRFYFPEDKWIFYLQCTKHNIPTLKTILLSENPGAARRDLKKFDEWPVVIKMVSGCRGEMIDKADNLDEAENIIKTFREKSLERIPLIAQEFENSPCYRVTVIGGKILQGAIKDGGGWKKTGVYEKKIESFAIDEKLKEIVEKIIKVSGIEVCGVDLLKNDDWRVLEVNAEPAFDFFEEQREMLIDEVVKYLKEQAEMHNHTASL